MKLRYLLDRLDRMPMLKALVPFVAGLLLAEVFTLPLWFTAGVFVCSGVAALLLRSSRYTLVLLASAGFGVAALHNREPEVVLGVATHLELTIESTPSDRGHYTSSEARINSWRDPTSGHWVAVDDRVIVWADSLTLLNNGDRLRVQTAVRPFRSGAGNYRVLMERRGFVGTLRISEQRIVERLPQSRNSLHRRAIERIAHLGVTGDAGAVLRAMVTGDRSGITPELRANYSRSGLSHLLAVSGLHTGMVFVLINTLLWWMALLRRGHLWRNLIAAGCIWIFVAAAGFPPSGVRAAVMCTMLQFALASASEYSGINALAMAAFGMLLYNPAWIGDISFQLSFIAVAGILAWGVPLCRRLHTRYRPLNWVIDAFAISLVATLVTAPLVCHTFGIVPIFGLIINPFAILMSTVVVFAGVSWMLLPFDLLKPLLNPVVELFAGGVNRLADLTASLDRAAIDHTLSARYTLLVYLIFAVVTLLSWCAKPKKSVHLPS